MGDGEASTQTAMLIAGHLFVTKIEDLFLLRSSLTCMTSSVASKLNQLKWKIQNPAIMVDDTIRARCEDADVNSIAFDELLSFFCDQIKRSHAMWNKNELKTTRKAVKNQNESVHTIRKQKGQADRSFGTEFLAR